VVATNEVCLALLDDVPVLLQVVKLVAVGGSGLVDAVADLKTSFLGGIGEDVGVLVLANAAKVDNGLGREDVLQEELEWDPSAAGVSETYLSTSGGVLGSTTGSQDGFAVLEDYDNVTTGQMSTFPRCTNGPRRCPCASPRLG
jgi:hypothetical protein